jgi:hypothetical protein
MQNLASTLSIGAGGEVNNYHCEAALEQLTVSNVPLIARNNYGRKDFTGSCCRAPWISAHVDQYAPSVNLAEIFAGNTSGSINIKDDACDAVNPATTVTASATAHYLRDANSSGNATCAEFVLNTDPGAKFGVTLFTTEYFTNSTMTSGTAELITFTSGYAFGVVVPQPVITIQVTLTVKSPGVSPDNYDIGLLNAYGIVTCHTGTILGSTLAAGSQTISWINSLPCTLYPGKYYVALTSNCATSCAVIDGGATATIQTFFNASVAFTTAETLNNVSPSVLPDNASQTATSIPALWVH